MQPSTSIRIQGKTNGRESSEHRITWVTMLASLIAIAAQVAGKLWLGIDLGVNIDLALATGFGSGATYTVARMVVKTGVTFAEGKVKAAHAVETVKAKVVDPVTDLDTVEATVIPPARNPLAMSDPKEDTRVW